MTVQVVNRLTLFKQVTAWVSALMVLLALPLAAVAADTTPAAKIVEMDIFAGPTGYIRLDPAVTVTIPGFTNCTTPNNFFVIPTSTDMDRPR